MLVAAHAHSRPGIQVAIEEGVDSIEHATLISREQAELVAAHGISIAPTLLINEAIAAARVPVTADAQAKAAELVVERDARLRAAAAAGVTFVLGTDANGHHVDFGDEMDELVRMHEVIGLEAESCLKAATSGAAAAIGLGATIGRLAPGYCADLLIVRGCPWRDIRDLTIANVVAVVARGEVVAGALPTL
jgi:imidazolonepropionase-like amidohydrolase